jgi:hypothetical protein
VSDRLTASEFRRELLDLLPRATPFSDELDRDDELPEGGVPTAVLLVVEWQASDGKRWLSRIGTLASGDDPPGWTLRMLAREALTWDDE